LEEKTLDSVMVIRPGGLSGPVIYDPKLLAALPVATAVYIHGVFPRIVRLPVFHNSSNDYVLPVSFHESAVKLRCKFPNFGPNHTLCGTVK
jgi:hypothetical protein